MLPIKPDYIRVGGGLQLLNLILESLNCPVHLPDLVAVLGHDVRRLGVLRDQGGAAAPPEFNE